MKTDDVRGPFGFSVLAKTVIFIKCQGLGKVVDDIWLGRIGSALVMVFVIFRVALWWQWL